MEYYKNHPKLMDHCKNYIHSLWETTQTLFWASLGLISLDNFELAGIKVISLSWQSDSLTDLRYPNYNFHGLDRYIEINHIHIMIVIYLSSNQFDSRNLRVFGASWCLALSQSSTLSSFSIFLLQWWTTHTRCCFQCHKVTENLIW